MIVFSQEVFNGVDINCIDTGSTGCLLMMMMFVYTTIYGFDVQCPMEDGVEKVVNYKDDRQRK